MSKFRVTVGMFAVDFTFADTIGQIAGLNTVQSALMQAVQGVASPSNLDASKIVGNLIKKYDNVSLVDRNASGNYIHRLTLTLEGWTYKLYVYNESGFNLLWQGALSSFSATTTQIKSYTQLKNKVIRFKYEAGSDPGATRLVKVKGVEGNMLHAHDLVKNEHRQFVLEKISGVQEVTV